MPYFPFIIFSPSSLRFLRKWHVAPYPAVPSPLLRVERLGRDPHSYTNGVIVITIKTEGWIGKPSGPLHVVAVTSRRFPFFVSVQKMRSPRSSPFAVTPPVLYKIFTMHREKSQNPNPPFGEKTQWIRYFLKKYDKCQSFVYQTFCEIKLCRTMFSTCLLVTKKMLVCCNWWSLF